MKMPELVPLSDDEYKILMKLVRDWLLLGLWAILLFIIATVMVYFKLGNRIILGFLMIIQLCIIPVAIFYYLKNRKLIKELRTRARPGFHNMPDEEKDNGGSG